MQNCLTSMSKAERQKMITFCYTMLGTMKERFGISTKKGEANSQIS